MANLLLLESHALWHPFLQGRILMEVNYMLSFGSGEASLRLLWRFGLLELLLPFQVRSLSPGFDNLQERILFHISPCKDFLISKIIQASYFVSQRFKRRDKGSNLLLVSLGLHCSLLFFTGQHALDVSSYSIFII